MNRKQRIAQLKKDIREKQTHLPKSPHICYGGDNLKTLDEIWIMEQELDELESQSILNRIKNKFKKNNERSF